MIGKYSLLQMLFVFGLVSCLLYPLSILWPSGWSWHAGAPMAAAGTPGRSILAAVRWGLSHP